MKKLIASLCLSLCFFATAAFADTTVFTGLDIFDGAAGVTGPARLFSTVSPTQPYPTATGFGAGSIRTYMGDYRDAFWISGGLCMVAASLMISTRSRSPVLECEPDLAQEPV